MNEQATTQHTPGPWWVHGPTTNAPKTHVMAYDGDDTMATAHVYGLSPVEELANARLIAAAPSMHKALRHLAEFGAGMHPDTVTQVARAALAAATAE